MKDLAVLKSLVGQNLKGYEILEMFEVVSMDVDGRKVGSVGFFKRQHVAELYVGSLPDPSYNKVVPAFVLTNGTAGFVIDTHQDVVLFDDAKEEAALRQKLLDSLSPAQRTLLGVR